MLDWRRLLGSRWSPKSEQRSFLHDGLEGHIMRRSHRMKRIMREQWGHFLPSALQQVDEVQSCGVLMRSQPREKDSAVERSSRPLSLRRAR
jgi:hypothetical protein